MSHQVNASGANGSQALSAPTPGVNVLYPPATITKEAPNSTTSEFARWNKRRVAELKAVDAWEDPSVIASTSTLTTTTASSPITANAIVPQGQPKDTAIASSILMKYLSDRFLDLADSIDAPSLWAFVKNCFLRQSTASLLLVLQKIMSSNVTMPVTQSMNDYKRLLEEAQTANGGDMIPLSSLFALIALLKIPDVFNNAQSNLLNKYQKPTLKQLETCILEAEEFLRSKAASNGSASANFASGGAAGEGGVQKGKKPRTRKNVGSCPLILADTLVNLDH